MSRVEKPWGYELIWARTPTYVGEILHINAGESLSLQYHRIKEENIFVYRGRMLFEHFQEGEPPTQTELGPGGSFHITPGLRHRMTAIEDCEIFEVSTPHLDDVVRLEDRYGRSGTSTP